ncbi:MAG: glutamate--tRNA ligase [Dehalococcoidia bacterium]
MSESVRVRFAPSPTGEPHVGNIRTAIFDWLFARNQALQGKETAFIIRIEDTDVARRVEGAVESTLEALRWLGLDWDEGPDVGGPYGPYVQSQRLPSYQEAVNRLVEQGDAYSCYCSPERLDEMRREQRALKRPPGYDRRCRDLNHEERQKQANGGTKTVVRFKMPLEGTTVCHDLIRGQVEFENRLLDDFVILKSDGYPTYHLASVVDDHAMEISHVLRAEEWLSSLPRHLKVYEALGYSPPLFAHLPIILGPDRAKLSKRHGATAVLEYRRLGYLPEAMLNFLTLLGWSLDDHTEVMSTEQLIQHFSLERITSSAAIFNQEKLTWLNGVYIREFSPEELARRIRPFLESQLSSSTPHPLDDSYLLRIVPLIQERLKTLAEAPALTEFFFQEKLKYDSTLLLGRDLDQSTAHGALQRVIAALGELPSTTPWDATALEGVIRPLAEKLGLKTGQLFGIIRVGVTGRIAAPPLFQTMEVLGRERCLSRLHVALDLLTS